MALEFERDFTGYFDTAFGGHGTLVSYTPNGGNAKSIKIILNEEYVDMNTGSVSVEGYNPVATIQTIDVAGIQHGDTIAVPAQIIGTTTIKAATTYSVINVQHDNTGVTAALLEAQ
tara:strand:+ start:148 stop:495 length:348 start_codon:yes stop_codon:yes gene_type:complete